MAVLGKIRSKGVILICVIGFALFAFIAEELFRSCDALGAEKRAQVGEVLGDKVNYQDFQKLVEEYTNVIKMTQGRDNLTEEELDQVRDGVWSSYVQNKIVESEAEKLGLKVTDKEMQNVLNAGTNPMLLQTPFVNQQTGRFDANLLKQFLAEYKQAQGTNSQMAEQYRSLYDFWTFIEKTLRQQLLMQKYQSLLAGCLLSNPVSAKMAYNDENQESNIELAAFPYSSINDNTVKVTDSELQAKYDELKPRFKQDDETRSIKFVDFQILPSQADRTELNKVVNGYMVALRDTADPSGIIRKSGSVVAYLGIPQTKAAFPSDIAARLDSIAVGTTTSPVENKTDNTLNVIKLISKVTMPDSVQFRAIQVGGATADEAVKRADSIYTALQAGADFEAVAKKYGQTGEKTWITSAQYQNAPSMDNDTKNYINTLNTLGVNETKNIKLTQGNIVLQVTDRKAMTNKYVAAVIKKPIEFSKDTYSAAYNKFSRFVSENQTLEAMQKNAAKYGYTVRERADVRNSEHYVAGVSDTREAMKWLFGAKENEVSPLYECGENDHLMVVALERVNKAGYRNINRVADALRAEIRRDKKAEKIMAQMTNCTSVDQVKALENAVSDTVKRVTFSAPAYIAATGNVLSEEKMAVIIQEICGTEDQGYFFPTASGVARSINFRIKGTSMSPSLVKHPNTTPCTPQRLQSSISNNIDSISASV